MKNKKKLKDVLRVSALPVVFASMCCLSPVILVLAGLGTVSFASSLADTLYGDYKWYFRSAGLLLLAASVFFYFYRTKGVCTLDEVKKRRNEIINTVMMALVVSVSGYVFFLYVIVHYIGVFLNLWD